MTKFTLNRRAKKILGNSMALDIFMGISVALMWGSAFTAARIIVEEALPLTISALRFLIAGTMAIAIARSVGQSWSLNSKQWRATAIIGLSQNALYLGLFFVGVQWIEASLATILASMLPLIVTLLDRLFFNKRIKLLGMIGLFLGACGVTLIMGNHISNDVDIRGVIACVIGVFALAAATLSVRGASLSGNILMIVGLQMLIGGIILVIISIFFEDWGIDWTTTLILALSYKIIVPSLIATWIWFSLIARIGATEASTFHFLNPFFGVAIAALILEETMTFYDYLGVIIISCGILAVQISKQQNHKGTSRT